MADLELIRLTSQFEPKVKRAFQDAFGSIRSRLTEQRIIEALRQGGVSAVIRLLDDMEGVINANATATLQDALIQSGRLVGGSLPGVIGSDFNFNLVNNRALQQLQNEFGQRVREVSNQTRQIIFQRTEEGLIAGRNPRAIARELRGDVGLTTTQQKWVENFRRSLTEANRTELNRVLRDEGRLLRDRRFDRTIERIVDGEQIPSEKIDQMVSRYQERLRDKRLRDITRTETMRALSAGEQEGLDQLQSQGQLPDNLRKFWVYTQDERTRLSHRMVPSLNFAGVRVDERFQTGVGHLRFPRDPTGKPEDVINCRCALVYRLVGRDNSPIGQNVPTQIRLR